MYLGKEQYMKSKHLLIVILMTIFCIPMISLNVKAENEEEYTPIYTIADLAGINNNPEGNYILMNDIDMTEETKPGGTWDTGHGWTPLKEFSGTLDGNGYRIISMNIYGEAYINDSIGLFASLDEGHIKNLGMVNVNINISGYNDHDYDYYEMAKIGAITGRSSGGYIENCYVTGNIITPENDFKTSGLVGGGSGTIENCYNAATVSGYGISDGVWSDSCYSIGSVTKGEWSVYTLQGTSQDGEGEILTETQMRLQNMYVGFDFENVWEIDPNSSYPYPQLKNNRQQRIEGLEVVTPPTKTIYGQGDKVDLTGGTVKIIYEDNYTTTVVMTEDMLEKYDTTQIGNQNITVKYGNKQASFPITVSGISVESVKISGNSNTMQKGTSMQLKAVIEPANATEATVTWSSSNTQVATIDATGKVTALQTGDTTITATASNGINGQYSIKVTAPCVSLTLNNDNLTIYKGETATLTATLSPLDTTDTVSWKSSNTNIVAVDNNGQLTGYSAGEAKITAVAGTATTTCNVTVKQKMDDFYIIGVVDKEYTGDNIEQEVKVTDGVVVLKEDTDYTVSYIDNVDVGTAKVHIMGKRYYEGSIEKSFNIVKKSSIGSPSKPSNEDSSELPENTPSQPSNEDSSELSENNTPKLSIGKTTISKIKNVKKKKAKVTFKSVKGADGYEIRYSVKSSMKNSKTKSTKRTSYKISSLKKKKYYVQVRAYAFDDSGEKVYGKWSAKKSITIKK